MKVLVAHPGMQHAHQLAWAVEEAGYLAAFWSGVPVADSRGTDGTIWSLLDKRLRSIPVSSQKRWHPVVFPLLRKLSGMRVFKYYANAWSHRVDRGFDAWVAVKIKKLRPDLVVCYENAALHTFMAAREFGAACVLDAASVHYLVAREWLSDTGQVNPAWIDAGKQQEIDLADAILTCSGFASDTYRDAGVPSHRLFPVPVGTPLPDQVLPDKFLGANCRYIFVGSLIRRKAVDILLDIFEELGHDGRGH